MKKIVPILLLLTLLIISSCGLPDFRHRTPESYVRHCVFLLDRDGLYADTPEWKAKKKEILAEAKAISSLDEAHYLVQAAADVAGGKHSFLIPPVTDTTSYQEFPPEVQLLEGNILLVKLPAHTGVKISDSIYVHTVFDFLQEHLDATGVIVDLRDNTGGNMGPMITAVSPLLPDGIVLKFKSRKRTTPIGLKNLTYTYNIVPDNFGKFPSSTPVAILTNGMTGSSGEATLLCFRGLDNTRTFGSPSAGYASGNVTHTLSDGYRFAITRSCDVARTGEIFCDDPIEPDVATETPLEDAIGWIESSKQ